MSTATTEKIKQFRLLRGIHYAPGPEGCQCDRCALDRQNLERKKEHPKHKYTIRHHRYSPGDIIKTNQDLTVLNRPGSTKVELVDDRGQVVRTEVPPSPRPTQNLIPPVPQSQVPGVDQGQLETLNAMTIPELRKAAAEEQIDLSGCNTKAEIITRLAGSM